MLLTTMTNLTRVGAVAIPQRQNQALRNDNSQREKNCRSSLSYSENSKNAVIVASTAIL